MVPPWLSFSSVDLRVDLRGSQECRWGGTLDQKSPPCSTLPPYPVGLRQGDQRLSRTWMNDGRALHAGEKKVVLQYVASLPCGSWTRRSASEPNVDER